MHILLERKKERRPINRRDFILAAVILAAALILFLFLRFREGKQGEYVMVRVDGETLGSYPLDEDRSVPIRSDFGYNELVIRDGKAYIDESDCPNHYCIRQGKISRENETIVCLPHKLVVEIGAGDDGGDVKGGSAGVDAVAQ